MPGSGRQLEKWAWLSVARMGLYAERGIALGGGHWFVCSARHRVFIVCLLSAENVIMNKAARILALGELAFIWGGGDGRANNK